MPDYSFFKKAFDDLATDGKIGALSGSAAYAYIRVSSSGQADEGRSGLPRQIEHCHHIAKERGLSIDWPMVFADDDSGFEFEDRPALSRLRAAYKSGDRAAHHVVMEHLDRLSRNADWHQGYLLDEMRRHSIEPVFWKSFSGRIERAVIGAISQEGMEDAKARMREGTVRKAQSGRITTKNRTYGYKFVDSQGNEGISARRDTHYALEPYESAVAERIFRDIAYQKHTARQMAIQLDREGVKPPANCAYWSSVMICYMIKNPVYKGEFAANRWKMIRETVEDHLGRTHKRNRPVLRPQEEWIIVPVPPVVSADLWQLANDALQKNVQSSPRNQKRQYLLTGLLHCGICGRSFNGLWKTSVHNGKKYGYPHYHCSSYVLSKERRALLGCTNRLIPAKTLDAAVWSVCYMFLTEPDRVDKHLDKLFRDDKNQQTINQIAYLDQQIAELTLADERLQKGYLAGAYELDEFAEKRKSIKAQIQRHQESGLSLRGSLITQESIEEKKQSFRRIAAEAHKLPVAADAPFELRRQIIRVLVDSIIVDVPNEVFIMDGIVPGRFSIVKDIAANTVHNLRFRCFFDRNGNILDLTTL